MTVFASATPAQRAGALRVWQAARVAGGIPPSEARVDRVRAKLADEGAQLLVGCDGDRVVAMALVEPFREEQGDGAVRSQAGHLAMVFVDPELWGRGVGGRLLDAVHREMRARGLRTSSVWTRSENVRAGRLYEGRGYRPTGDAKRLRGHAIVRYELRLEPDRAG